MAKNNMNKEINKIAKSAKRNHGATIAIVAGAALSVIGNITIGTMTVVKAVKNKKKAVDDDKKAADPQPALPAPAPAPAADNNSNNNPPEGGNQDNQNPENK